MRRGLLAAAILAAWLVGVGLLVRREFFVGSAARLADAALRLSPGASYYVVSQGGAQIGFASTTLDTLATGIEVVDWFIADLPVAGTPQRASARSIVHLSRALALQTFDVQVESQGTPLHVGGRADGDSAVVFALSTGKSRPDSQRVAVRGPILLPTLVPLVLALGERPTVGKTYRIPTFDPQAMLSRDLALTVRAESLFVLVDSARFDQGRAEWVPARSDTTRAWRIEPVNGAGFTGWIDGEGRVVASTQPGGITLQRIAYEIAFENWRIARDRRAVTATGTKANDIIERSAIGAGALLGRTRLSALAVRLRGVDLEGYDLAGGRQQLRGDVLQVERERPDLLSADWTLSGGRPLDRSRFRAELGAEPLLQSNDARLVSLAVRIAGNDRDPRVVAEKLERWVFDSLTKEVTLSVPNALDVLRTRKGDCNEHTQLYVALARAVGIPARVATGLAYVNGKFYYHAWPEIWLRDWVAVDPTFGQFPADASHLRFVVGGLARQTELLRLIGALRIQVVAVR
jgi:hypothetical protein